MCVTLSKSLHLLWPRSVSSTVKWKFDYIISKGPSKSVVLCLSFLSSWKDEGLKDCLSAERKNTWFYACLSLSRIHSRRFRACHLDTFMFEPAPWCFCQPWAFLHRKCLQAAALSSLNYLNIFCICNQFFFFFKPWFSLNELSHLKWPWTVCFPVHPEIPQVAPFRLLHFMHAYWLIYSILLYSFPGPKNTEIRWSWVLYKKWLYSLPSHFNFLLFLGSQDPQASRLFRLNICNPW